MKRLFGLILILCSASLAAQDYSWESVDMDGSRRAALEKGEIKLKKNSAAAKTIALVEAAQPAMARVKEVIGYSTEALSKSYPESKLSNWTVDTIMEKVASLSGKKVDVGFANFGGIRVDMPKGDILLDDILSMFPFKNNLVYIEHKGSTLRGIFEWMASTRVQAVGGVKMVVENGKLVSAEIAGEPIDDEKIYGVATISFLLKGGDGITMEDGALTIQNFDVDIIDAVLEHVYAETAAGRPITAKPDGRVVIKK